jgi:hypothetical protein
MTQFSTPGHGAGSNAAIAPTGPDGGVCDTCVAGKCKDVPDSHAAATSVLELKDAMAVVIKEMDLETAMKARVVCKSLRRWVKDAGLEPLEAGCEQKEMARGRECQKDLEEALALENQVWTAKLTAEMAQHLTHQQEITAEMRYELVNWLIEIHFKFKCHRQLSLYLCIKLVDLFLAYNKVPRVTFQNVGVSAFRLACNCEDEISPEISDLSYITDRSSSEQEIIDMQNKILKQFEENLKHPNPATFLWRFSEAAMLSFAKSSHLTYSKEYSIALCFIDTAMLDATLVATRPSLIAAAAIMCTLRVLRRSDWSKHLDHYTTYTRETVAKLADQLIANGCEVPSAIELKYTSQRLGGKGDQVGADGKTLNDGCLHILADYYARVQ